MKRLLQRMLAALLGMYVLLPGLPAAFAFNATKPPDDAKAIFQWIASLAAAGACAAIVFKNAKRSHQG